MLRLYLFRSNYSLTVFPRFFLQEKDQGVTIGLSFLLEKGKPQAQIGHLYYPLELVNVNSGNSFSINAPFVLDMSRKALGSTYELNKVLTSAAGEIVGQLFRKVLLKKYGPHAYNLLLPQCADDTPGFQDFIVTSLKKYKVVINDTYDESVDFMDGFFCQREYYQPTSNDLYGFIGDPEIEVSHAISDSSVRAFFTKFLEAKRFGLEDIVSLWINDKLPGHNYGGWTYVDRDSFIRKLTRIEAQIQYADVFIAHQKELKSDQIEKMRRSSSTLNSLPVTSSPDKKLNFAAKMRRWSRSVENVPNLNLTDIVHPQIANHPFFVNILSVPQFELNDYVLNVMLPNVNTMSTEKRIEALNFLITNAKELSGEAIEELKQASIFRSDDDSWFAFDEIVNGNNYLRTAFGTSLHYPHSIMLESNFIKIFPFRKTATFEEISQRVADLWRERSTLPKEGILRFETYLQRISLNNEQIQQILSQILTVDTKERICPVSKCYANKQELITYLGNDVHYVDFSSNSLYFKQFGAQDQPRFQDMLSLICQIRSMGEKLSNPGEFYVEFAAAKKRDLIEQSYDDEEIIFVGSKFVCPNKVFIHQGWKNHFFDSMYYWRFNLDKEGLIASALKELGCIRNPEVPEYLALLKWISTQLEKGCKLEERWRNASHLAYSQMPTQGIPQGVALEDRILLASDGTLTNTFFTSLAMAKNDHVFYKDNEEVAIALRKVHPEIVFFDCGQRGHDFFQHLPIRRLSDNVKNTVNILENESEASIFFKGLFDRLHSREVINGIQCFLEQNQQVKAMVKDKNCLNRIVSLRKAKFVASIRSVFHLNGYQEPFEVEPGACIDGDTLYIRSDLNENEISFEISKTISEGIVETRDAQLPVTLATNAFLTGLDVRKFLKSQNYSYDESIEVPSLTSEDTAPGQAPVTPIDRGLQPEQNTKQEEAKLDEEEKDREQFLKEFRMFKNALGKDKHKPGDRWVNFHNRRSKYDSRRRR